MSFFRHVSSFQAFAISLFDHLRAVDISRGLLTFFLLRSINSFDSICLVLASWVVIIWVFPQDFSHMAWLALLDVAILSHHLDVDWMSMVCRNEDDWHHLLSIFLIRVLLPRSTFMDLAMLCLSVDGALG